MATIKQGTHETINSRVLIGTQAAIFICDAWQMFIELSKANKFLNFYLRHLQNYVKFFN
jgi:hypothetical protein